MLKSFGLSINLIFLKNTSTAQINFRKHYSVGKMGKFAVQIH